MRRGRASRSLARVLVPITLALALVLLQTAVAGASTRHVTPAVPSLDTVQVGPIAAGDGFRLYLTARDCGSSDPYLEIAYRTAGSPDILSHTYTGASASCQVQRRPAEAELRADLPGLIDVAVRIATTGAALAHPGLPVGCGAPYGPELPAIASGQIDVAIHPAVFGDVAVQTAGARIFSGAPQRCPAPQSTAGTELTAVIGPAILDADQPTHGPAQLDVVDDSGDSPSPELQGVTELQLSGRAALSVDAADGSASIGADTSVTVGSLSFTALPACPGSQAQNGTLSGTLTIADPLLGALQLIGVRADTAFMGLGTDQPGICNGPGSGPVMPDLVSSCNSTDSDCSVSDDSAVVTLFDETDPGTQAITSETVDFGDGSPPVPITNFGSVQHTYGSPGTDIATLTVTDALGTVSTVTTPVVIDP